MLSGHTTCYLPFWPILTPEANSKFLIQYSSFFDDMPYTNPKVRSSLLNRRVVHELIFTERLGDSIVGSGAKTFA